MNPILPWYIAGPLIGLIVPLLLVLREKQFGISSSYRYLLSGVFRRIPYFSYAREKDKWQVQFCIGLVLSGTLVQLFFSYTRVEHSTVVQDADWKEFAATIYEDKNLLLFLLGGILVGFGSRLANGCTAGHCIMGVSQLAKSSIVTTVAFFVGGWLTSNFILKMLL